MHIHDVQQLARTQNRAGDVAERRLWALWKRLPLEDLGTLEDALYQLYPRLVEESAEVASSAALEWYEKQREAEGVAKAYSPVMPTGLVDENEAAKIVGAAIRDLREGVGRARVLTRLTDGARKLISDAGRATTQHAAERDPKKPRYARVPTGAETCAWCMLWASRGFVYKSEETAQFKRSHFKCDCQIVPSWDKRPRVRGYDSKRYERMYQQAVDDLADEGARTDDIKTITARMRELFPDQLTDGRTPQRVSSDGTLQRSEIDKDRSRALAVLQERGLTPGAARRLPPREMTQAPKDWPDGLPPLRAKEWRHTLYGLRRSGGHLSGYGWRFGRTEFPADWTPDDILQAGAQVLREKGVREGVNLASATGRVNGVTIRVAYRNDAKGYRVKSIIPVEK
nr:EndoU domain-containing protein [uncultured Actinomyces sp.]